MSRLVLWILLGVVVVVVSVVCFVVFSKERRDKVLSFCRKVGKGVWGVGERVVGKVGVEGDVVLDKELLNKCDN